MRNIMIMIGPPCSGKSTLGKKYAKKYNINYISSGDIARSMGDKVIYDLNNGKLAPEDRIRDGIQHAISDSNGDIILDGFPRFKDQLQYLTDILVPEDRLIFIIVDVTLSNIINRSISRGRSDDVAIFGRLSWYVTNTLPMMPEIYKIRDNTDAEIIHVLNILNHKDGMNDTFRFMDDIIGIYRRNYK